MKSLTRTASFVSITAMQKINRRQMIQILGAGAASVYLGGCTSTPRRPASPSAANDWQNLIGPVDRSLGDHMAKSFSGDYPTLTHEILWNKQAFLKKHGTSNQP